MSASEIDVSVRGGAGWKEFVQGLREWGVTIENLWVPTDAGIAALRTAFAAGSCLTVRVIDDNGYGWSGSCIVTALGRGEPLDGAVTMPVTLKGTGAPADETPST